MLKCIVDSCCCCCPSQELNSRPGCCHAITEVQGHHPKSHAATPKIVFFWQFHFGRSPLRDQEKREEPPGPHFWRFLSGNNAIRFLNPFFPVTSHANHDRAHKGREPLSPRCHIQSEKRLLGERAVDLPWMTGLSILLTYLC